MQFSITDIETTGFSPGKHELLTAHVILTDGKNKLDERGFKFKPTKFRPDYHKAYKVHGITIEEARTYPLKASTLETFLNFIPDDSIMVCHSRKSLGFFDYGFLSIECYLANMGMEFNRTFKWCLSTYDLAYKYGKFTKDEKKKLSLDRVCEHYGIELNHHNAESDTKACYELFKIFYEAQKAKIDKSISFIN